MPEDIETQKKINTENYTSRAAGRNTQIIVRLHPHASIGTLKTVAPVVEGACFEATDRNGVTAPNPFDRWWEAVQWLEEQGHV